MTTSVTSGGCTTLAIQEFDIHPFDLWLETELMWMGWGENEPDKAKIARETALMWELCELNKLAEVRGAKRRPSRMAGHMTRNGSGRHTVRKNHGTKAFYKAIEVENAGRQSWQKNSVRSRRRFSKLAASCQDSGILARARLELIDEIKPAV